MSPERTIHLVTPGTALPAGKPAIVFLVVRRTTEFAPADAFTIDEACKLGSEWIATQWDEDSGSSPPGSQSTLVALVSPELPVDDYAPLFSSGFLVLAAEGKTPEELLRAARTQLGGAPKAADAATSDELATPEAYLNPPFPLNREALEHLVARHNAPEDGPEYDD